MAKLPALALKPGLPSQPPIQLCCRMWLRVKAGWTLSAIHQRTTHVQVEGKATLIMGPECSKHIGVSVQVALDIRNFAGWDGTMLGQVSILQDQHQPREYRQLVCLVWGTLSIIVYYHVLSIVSASA